MSLAESLTPENTEEVKPGLFIQQRRKGYKQIEPLAWNGKFRWREQLKTVFCWRTLFFLIVLGLLFWSYKHDKQTCYEMMENPQEFCINQFPYGIQDIVSCEKDMFGDCINGEIKRDENNYTIPSYP